MIAIETTLEFDRWNLFNFNQSLSIRKWERYRAAKHAFENGNFPIKVKLIIAQIGQHHVSECTSFRVEGENIRYFAREHKTKWHTNLAGYRNINLDDFCKYLAVTRRIVF